MPDLRFDVVTFCCNCTNVGSLMCTQQFNHMNFPTANGHYVAMGDDTHRAELLTNGNLLAIYYNTLTGWTTNSAAVTAANINQDAVGLFTHTGPRPDWIVLNEISSGTWPADAFYRGWVRDVVHALHVTYGYSVIVYSPFANPASYSTDWQAVAADAYIGIENYLSGQDVVAHSFSVSWCQSQYQSSIASYNALGISSSRLILGEHFAQTVLDTGYGRSGVSSNDWDKVITARDTAAHNCAFAGFIGYAWSKNGMVVSEGEMIHFEDTYAVDALPKTNTLSLPFPAAQPQSQTIPPGGTASFNVVPAGNAPVSYQWRFNGLAIAGATASSLTVTDLAPANAGYYAVLLSNAVGSTLSSNALLAVQVPPPMAQDSFTNSTAAGGTLYSPGAALIGQTNGQNQTWFQAGPNSGLANQPVIQANSLSVTGLASASGNSVKFGGTGGMAARFQMIPAGSSITTGTTFYSFALKLTDLTALSSSGVFWAGFNNSAGFQTTTPLAVGTRIYTRAAGAGYNLGLSKASSTASEWVWDNTVHAVNEIIFLVGSYTCNIAATNDDVSSLWINPAPATFGRATAPPPTLTTSAGADISSYVLRSFLIMNRDPNEPAAGLIDEVRVGASWASVTPPGVTPPTLNIVRSGTNVVLSWSTNASGFALLTAPTLASNAWGTATQQVYKVGDQYNVTNTVSSGPAFFRLLKP